MTANARASSIDISKAASSANKLRFTRRLDRACGWLDKAARANARRKETLKESMKGNDNASKTGGVSHDTPPVSEESQQKQAKERESRKVRTRER